MKQCQRHDYCTIHKRRVLSAVCFARYGLAEGSMSIPWVESKITALINETKYHRMLNVWVYLSWQFIVVCKHYTLQVLANLRSLVKLT